MESPPLLAFDELLRPISDAQPAGSDLRERPEPGPNEAAATTAYYDARAARTAARAIEDRARTPDESTVEALKHWRTVSVLVAKALTAQTKDLDLVAWWIEALARESGWIGLRDGFRLARELVERYWTGIYPLPDDEDGDAARVQQFVMLNGRDDSEGPLVRCIRLIPFAPAADGAARLSLWTHTQATKPGASAADGPTLESFQASVAALSDERIATVLDDLEACAREWAAFDVAVGERCGVHALPTSKITKVLEEALACWRSLAKDRIATPAAANTGGGSAGAGATNDAAPDGSSIDRAARGPIQTRADAFRTLSTVAAFFRRTEPHSPIPFVLERAIRWGDMPLPELLEEWMGNREACDPVFKLIGIPPAKSETP